MIILGKNFKAVPLIATFIVCYLLGSCRKLVEAPPPTNSILENNLFSDNNSAIAVLTGIYSGYGGSASAFSSSTAQSNFSILLGLSSDELSLSIQTVAEPLIRHYTNNLKGDGLSGDVGHKHWIDFYKSIYSCNAAIMGLSSSKAQNLTPSIQKQLMGEAKFTRAFLYFYLTNLYGNLPLVTTTDPKVNLQLTRSSQETVYRRIKEDLEEAISLLSEDFLSSTMGITTERVRPTKWAAIALMARVCLYTGDFSGAITYSTLILNHNSLFGLTGLNEVFLKNSREAIWQIQPIVGSFNTLDAVAFTLPSSGPNTTRPVYLSPQLLNSFEPNDLRRVNGNWVNSVNVGPTIFHYPFKYKVSASNSNINSTTGTTNMTEYLMILRVAEQFLIRAEAKAQLNDLTGAISDIDVIRSRAGLPLIANTNPGILKAGLLDLIIKEKFTELFSELGHRWLDLKRTDRIDGVMAIVTPQKSQGLISWRPYQCLYPLPFNDVQSAANVDQNAGY